MFCMLAAGETSELLTGTLSHWMKRCCWVTFDLCSVSQCLEFSEGSVTGDMCEDLCVLSLVEYKRCLYYENGKKVIEARWRGSPIILKSKLENFSSYEPLGILDYQVMSPPLCPLAPGRSACFKITLLLVLAPTGRSRGALPARCHLLRHSGGKRLQFGADESKFLWVRLHFLSPQVRNSLGLAEENEDEDRGGGGVNNGSLARLLGKKLKNREKSYSRAELASLWALLQQEEYTFLR